MQARGDQKNYVSKEGVAKSVIQIVLPGGMAHQESWDPKPEAPLEYRGPFGVAKTKLPGVVFNENFKALAGVADKMTVIRSIAGKEADHGRAVVHDVHRLPQEPGHRTPEPRGGGVARVRPAEGPAAVRRGPDRDGVRRHRLPRLAVRAVRHRQRPGPQRLQGPRPDAAAGRGRPPVQHPPRDPRRGGRPLPHAGREGRSARGDGRVLPAGLRPHQFAGRPRGVRHREGDSRDPREVRHVRRRPAVPAGPPAGRSRCAVRDGQLRRLGHARRHRERDEAAGARASTRRSPG